VVPLSRVVHFSAILCFSRQIWTSSTPSSSPCETLTQRLLPVWLPDREGLFLLRLLKRWQSTTLIFSVCKFVVCVLLCLFVISSSLFLVSSPFLVSSFYLFVYFSWLFRVPSDSLICMLTTNMFVSPPKAFKLPPYAVGIAHQFAEAPSPPPLAHAVSISMFWIT